MGLRKMLVKFIKSEVFLNPRPIHPPWLRYTPLFKAASTVNLYNKPNKVNSLHSLFVHPFVLE